MTKKTEMRDQLAVLEVVFKSLPHLVSYIDSSLQYQYANPAYERWFNLKMSQIVGRSMDQIFDRSFMDGVQPHLKKALDGEVVEFETVLTRQGQPHKVRMNYIPDKNSDKVVVGIAIVVLDISHQVQQDEQLLESERRLRYALDATGEGVWDWGVKTGSVKHNRRWCDLLGLHDGFLEHPLEVFAGRIHPEDAPEVMKRLQACLDGQGPYASEHRLMRMDGTYIWVSDRGGVVERDELGAPTRMVGSFKDISIIREAQIQLIQSSKMASLGEMAGGVAHEINNPLAIIHAKAGQMLELLGDDDIDRVFFATSLEKIEKTVDRIAKIIKGLRVFSRNAEADPMENVKVEQVLEDTFELCRERLKNGLVELTITASDPELSFDCRPSQVAQILMNLVINSFDAIQSMERKWINVDISTKEDNILIRVTDSGLGIPQKVVDKMMEPFFTTKDVGKGTGLGLSISRGIALDHHGELRYDTLSKNTSFVLQLPVRQAS